MVRIAGVGEAFPGAYHRQADLARALAVLWREAPLEAATIERIHRHTTVEGRHIALPLKEYVPGVPWGEINRKWIRIADEIGTTAVRNSLEAAGMNGSEIGALVFVTVTGIATPSIDARIANRLDMPPTVRRLPLFGLGCVAGASGLARCAELVESRPERAAVLLSVELCSLTVQLDDFSMANVVATGLFGDGAAAVTLTANGRPATGPEIVASRSILYPGTERVMGWDISERGFRLVLSQEIPVLIREHLRKDVDSFLTDEGLKRSDVKEWMVHTGGPKIFSAIEESLELPDDALEATKETLRRVGNVSSASVLLVLKHTIERRKPSPGTYGLMLAVGPGFCSEMILVRW